MKKPKAQPKRKSPAVGVAYIKLPESKSGYLYTDFNTKSWNKGPISRQKARTIVGDRALRAGEGGSKRDTQVYDMSSSARSVNPKTRSKPKSK